MCKENVIYTQWSIIQPKRRMKSYCLVVCRKGQSETEISHAKENKPDSERKVLHVCSPMRNIERKLKEERDQEKEGGRIRESNGR
jgi:hypothetical protein